MATSGDYAISQNGDLTSVREYVTNLTIPNNVKRIIGTNNQNYALFPCRNVIETVTFSTNSLLEEIQSYSFFNCVKLNEIDLSPCTNLLSIGKYAFSNCTALETVLFPKNAKLAIINEYCFYYCSKLKEIFLPKTITTLGDAIFQNTNIEKLTFEDGILLSSFPSRLIREVSKIKSIEIPRSIKSFAISWAEYARNLATITVQEGNQWFIAKNNTIYTKNETNLITCAPATTGTFVIPEGVQLLGDCSFKSTRISGVEIPETVTYIGNWCFQASQLQSIYIPDSVTYLGEAAFDNNPKLATVRISNNITILYKMTFSYTNITTIELPKNLTVIEAECFKNCYNLESVILPDSITKLGGGIFTGCTKNPTIQFQEGSKFMIDEQYLIMDVNQTIVSNYVGSKTGAVVKIPETVQKVEGSAFLENTNIKEIQFLSDDTLTSIEDNALESCSSLEKINIPHSVVTIGEKAFYNCKLLKELIFGNSLNSIGEYAFANIEQIARISFASCINLESFPPYLFSKSSKLEIIDLPPSLESIGEYCFAGCSALHNLAFPPVFTYLSGNCFYESGLYEIYFNSSDNPYFTSIPDSAFYCSRSLTIVNIPNSVTSIGNKAFSETNISEINIPNTVINISDYCFENCPQLKSITIPPNLTYLGIQFVGNCPSLASFQSENILYPVEAGALYNYDRSQLIAFPVASTTKYFYIPDTVTYIMPRSFYGAKNLISVLIPEGKLNQIGYQAFAYCKDLTSINIPYTVNTVEREAFLGCKSLKCNVRVDNETLIEDLISTASMTKSMFQRCVPYSSFCNNENSMISYCNLLLTVIFL